MEIAIFGITFHLYGLIIGVAAVVALLLIEYRAKLHGISARCVWTAAAAVVGGGVIAARLWHIATDFQLYGKISPNMLFTWQGGLSIIGGVVGGILVLAFGLKYLSACKGVSRLVLADLAIFGLPVAQAIGRLGNFANQELYGLPTALPWKLYISPERRPPGFENSEYFHPLFAYEMAFTGLFALGVWWYDRKYLSASERKQRIGKGTYFLVYLAYYSAVRFGLDFFRIDKTIAAGTGLGINQLALVLGLAVIAFAAYRLKLLKRTQTTAAAALIIIGLVIYSVVFIRLNNLSSTPNVEQAVVQENLREIVVGSNTLTVELVDSPETLSRGLGYRDEIGSDGMLFLLPERKTPVFWMKGMRFAIDIVWIDAGAVVEITRNIPNPPSDKLPDKNLPRYSPSTLVMMVLELPAGEAERLGIKIGDQVSW